MNSNTEKAQESESTEPEKTDSEIKNLSPSATTNDIPEFGWSGYAAVSYTHLTLPTKA